MSNRCINYIHSVFDATKFNSEFSYGRFTVLRLRPKPIAVSAAFCGLRNYKAVTTLLTRATDALVYWSIRNAVAEYSKLLPGRVSFDPNSILNPGKVLDY